MAENIVGPFGPGINETLTRPTDTQPEGATDTWFQPCVDGTPGTGTKIPAVWLNKVAALFRQAIRGLGVPDVATDDEMLLKCFQKVDRAIDNVGDGAGEIYKELNADGRHKLRKIKAGTGVSIATSGNDVTISATGVGGSEVGLENVGDGAQIYKGFDGSNHEIRSVEGAGGIAVSVHSSGNKLIIDGSGVAGGGSGVVIKKRTRSVLATGHTAEDGDAATQAWAVSYVPTTAGATLEVDADFYCRARAGGSTSANMVSQIDLQWRHSGGAWTSLSPAGISGDMTLEGIAGKRMGPGLLGSQEDQYTKAYGGIRFLADITIPAGAPTIEFRAMHRCDSNGNTAQAGDSHLYAGSVMKFTEYATVS